MRRNWTRRKFLQTSLGSSLAVGAGAALGGRVAHATEQKSKAPAVSLSVAQRATLRAAMDEIVPAIDDMPSASAVGGVEYVSRVTHADAAIRKSISESLAGLEALSKKIKAKAFSSLTRAQRVETLRAFEKQSPEAFVTLRDFTDEAYYTEPHVWKLIGYELHPTNEAGPRVKPFDESVLAHVKKMPRRYREVT
ncbi:MAG: gluconate 2-dehydrogenase subunit 3 family protein [Acidobacteria bacterium]|nr:gluconate 2-dehydrogenase subunit 3 family protein [Acidobacteriota bacterium]